MTPFVREDRDHNGPEPARGAVYALFIRVAVKIKKRSSPRQGTGAFLQPWYHPNFRRERAPPRTSSKALADNAATRPALPYTQAGDSGMSYPHGRGRRLAPTAGSLRAHDPRLVPFSVFTGYYTLPSRRCQAGNSPDFLRRRSRRILPPHLSFLLRYSTRSSSLRHPAYGSRFRSRYHAPLPSGR